MRLAAFLAGLLLAASAPAQQDLPPNGLLLVAKPGLEDPNFSRSVVLVTQTPDFSTVGVILNRPTREQHQGQPLWFGGPVMPQAVVAVFRSGRPPQASAFHVLKNLYLSMHPQNLEPLLKGAGAAFRLYSGFAGWMPRQLESELGSGGWFVLPADEDIVFRMDTEGLWEELVARASKPRA